MPFVAQQQEKCTACNRTVYQTEKTVVEELDSKKVYHKTCIRCSFERCNKVLSLGEFSSIEGKFYCKPHFKQLFAEKGNFEEGFGLEKKSKGTVVTAPGTFVPVESTSTKQNPEKRETSEATAAKFRRFREDADSEKCTACAKTVYVTEKIVVEEKDSKKPYHKTCLKCSNEGYGRQLDLGSYVSQDGTIYCKPHFQQLFKSKGTFDSIDSKDKWKNAPVVTEKLSFVPKEDEGRVQTEKNKTSEATAAKIRLWRQESDSEVCAICTKSVAPVERLVVEEKNTKKIYHNACFKCSQCGVKLDLRNYGSHEGSIYCRPHLKGATVTNVKPTSSSSTVPNSFVPEVKEERSNQKSETPSHIAEKFKGLGNTEKCRSCGKSVYATEKLIVEELKQQHIYHKQCLRCSKCNIQLDASTYGSASGVIYCKVHLKQMSLPDQVKSENAYFVSPLRSASNDYVPQQQQQQQESEDDNREEEYSTSNPSEDTREQEQEEKEEEEEVSVQEPVTTSTPTSYKPSPIQSPKESPANSPAVARRQVDSEEYNNSDDERRKKREERERQREDEERKYQEEKEKRDREREERKKRREEEQDSNATEEDDAEKRKKEREERRKRREEEAQKELEEQEKKSEERKKRLEALKQ